MKKARHPRKAEEKEEYEETRMIFGNFLFAFCARSRSEEMAEGPFPSGLFVS